MANNLPKTVGLKPFVNTVKPVAQPEEQQQVSIKDIFKPMSKLQQVSIKDIFKPMSKLFRFVDPIAQSPEMLDYLVTQQHVESVQALTSSKLGNKLDFKA